MESQDFPVDHDIDGSIQVKFDAPRGLTLGQWVLDMRAVIQARQIADQSDSPNRTPANVFHQAVVDLGVGSNHHCAPSELAVVKSQEQAASVVEALRAVDSNRKRATVESSQSQNDR